MQVLPMRREPVARGAGVDPEALQDAPIGRRVIEVNKVRAFMRRDVIKDVGRREDQSPGKRKRAVGRA